MRPFSLRSERLSLTTGKALCRGGKLQFQLRTVSPMRSQPRLLRLKAEACRVLAEISEDITRKANWLEQADQWQALATEIEREQLRRPAPTIVLGDAWPAATATTAAQPRNEPVPAEN
jgi:hypothetical protein